MKLVIICYNIAIHEEVLEILEETGTRSYTRFEKLLRVGNLAGPHLGTNVWPAMNSVMFIALENDRKDRLIERIKELRKRLGKEAIKAFVLPLDEMT